MIGPLFRWVSARPRIGRSGGVICKTACQIPSDCFVSSGGLRLPWIGGGFVKVGIVKVQLVPEPASMFASTLSGCCR